MSAAETTAPLATLAELATAAAHDAAAEFGRGGFVPKAWIMDRCGLRLLSAQADDGVVVGAASIAAVERHTRRVEAQLAAALDTMRDVLREHHRMVLRPCGNRWEIVPADDHSAFAVKRGRKKIATALGQIAADLRCAPVAEMSAAAQAKHDATQARFAAFEQLVRKERRQLR